MLADPRAAIRGCATLALGGFPGNVVHRVLAMLHDPSAQVRASAALSLAALPAEQVLPPARAALALARERDPSAAVRRAARFALHRLSASKPAQQLPGWIVRQVEAVAWTDPVIWAAVEVDGMQLLVPVHGDHEQRWAVVPGLANARMSPTKLPLPRISLGSIE
jgi:HEAT repeat protein